ncbi:hypothetical protein HanRHA438_Chr05g0226171 [Helianthus annuus]|nr:hypothetical protein HanRHA438_Chr05g0226171 [Helianthus annuus]
MLFTAGYFFWAQRSQLYIILWAHMVTISLGLDCLQVNSYVWATYGESDYSRIGLIGIWQWINFDGPEVQDYFMGQRLWWVLRFFLSPSKLSVTLALERS